jgi:hypothetical protein
MGGSRVGLQTMNSRRFIVLIVHWHMYRHALPPGFILESENKAMEEAAKANRRVPRR